ncbi:MAG: hypothetical protein GXO32_07415 [Crenarchaeota archaeon]|nr:hypothetical protein [Thermoproteota archaeon]
MSVDAGILDSFAKILGIVSKKDRSTPLIYTIQSLQELKSRLESIYKRLMQRYEELMLKAIQSHERSDSEKFKIYAAEIVNVKRLMKVISVADLAVERVIERLKTIDIVRDIKGLASIVGILNELKMKMVNEMPELASLIDNIVHNVNTFIATSQAQEINVSPVENTREIEQAMKQIEEEAERRMRERMKVVLESKKIPLEKVAEVERVASQETQQGSYIAKSPIVPAAASYRAPAAVDLLRVPQTAEAVPTSLRIDRVDIERAVLEYIVEHGGILNVEECAKLLGVTRAEVISALKSLERKGLIRLAR